MDIFSSSSAILAKVLDRSIPGGLVLFREEASGDLSLAPVIGDALAAHAKFVAVVGASTKL